MGGWSSKTPIDATLGSHNNIGDYNSNFETVGGDGSATSEAKVTVYTGDGSNRGMAVWYARADLKLHTFFFCFLISVLIFGLIFITCKWLRARQQLQQMRRKARRTRGLRHGQLQAAEGTSLAYRSEMLKLPRMQQEDKCGSVNDRAIKSSESFRLTEEVIRLPLTQYGQLYNDSGLVPARPGFFGLEQ